MMSSVFELRRIDHVALNVSDMERSIAWYRDVLGMQRLYEEEWGDSPAMMCAGDACIALFRASVEDPDPPPGGDVLAARHVAFRVDRDDFQRAQEELDRRGIGQRFRDHGVTHSIYFQDPDGHQLEITTAAG